ncbi:hypothetical protein COT97_04220 [Candidatus Falkowbacteria bacterium CG10_big_fil_rev_8_21_14_0_10_39_11]|uniref:Uncharacterized protein n=1 Tax=Candidatus Falkowbacteria bacterium CG10_big_fil_rev_8_21_14_0_10_39_11 TaxID=1974565 RepID=A0A2H0V4A0_9BACT|nr:MAG: hypothetical protein COT97_04220 [Candidatus Falkowbacteria bacterium CG10_big_fil_rev_8_21_14_0_10_39_11]
MKTINSTSNSVVKEVKKLQQKKYRQETGLFVVENFKIISDAFNSGYIPVKIFVTSDFIKKNPEIDSIIGKVGEGYEIDDKVNKSISNLDSPAGILAVYSQIPEKFDSAVNSLYLNAISDPGNLGTLLRSAVAFDFHNVILDSGCVDLYNPKVIHAAKDAVFKLNFSFSKQLSDLKDDYVIVSTPVHDGGRFVAATKPVCLVLGSESHGVDSELELLADQKVTIKTSGQIESLNVAMAGAIIMEKIFNFK